MLLPRIAITVCLITFISLNIPDRATAQQKRCVSGNCENGIGTAVMADGTKMKTRWVDGVANGTTIMYKDGRPYAWTFHASGQQMGLFIIEHEEGYDIEGSWFKPTLYYFPNGDVRIYRDEKLYKPLNTMDAQLRRAFFLINKEIFEVGRDYIERFVYNSFGSDYGFITYRRVSTDGCAISQRVPTHVSNFRLIPGNGNDRDVIQFTCSLCVRYMEYDYPNEDVNNSETLTKHDVKLPAGVDTDLIRDQLRLAKEAVNKLHKQKNK